MGTERGSSLSHVPQMSRAVLAVLFLEEPPLYPLLYTEPLGFLASGSGWDVHRRCPPPPPSVPHPLTAMAGFMAGAKQASFSCCRAPGLPVFCFRHLARWFWSQIWGGRETGWRSAAGFFSTQYLPHKSMILMLSQRLALYSLESSTASGFPWLGRFAL